MSELDYYAVLGVTPSASLAEIKAAYRRFVLRAHPDRGGEAAEFRRVTEAFKTLRDPVKRLEYDHSLRAGTQEPDQTSPSSTRPARPPKRTRGPVRPPTGSPCWLCTRRPGQQYSRLRITLDRDDKPNRHVIVPCCRSCWSRRVPSQIGSMSAAWGTGWSYAFFPSMGLTGLVTLVELIDDAGLSELAMIVFWATAVTTMVSALGILRQVWRRTSTNLARIESAFRKRVEDYPPISALLTRGYRIRVETP